MKLTRWLLPGRERSPGLARRWAAVAIKPTAGLVAAVLLAAGCASPARQVSTAVKLGKAADGGGPVVRLGLIPKLADGIGLAGIQLGYFQRALGTGVRLDVVPFASPATEAAALAGLAREAAQGGGRRRRRRARAGERGQPVARRPFRHRGPGRHPEVPGRAARPGRCPAEGPDPGKPATEHRPRPRAGGGRHRADRPARPGSPGPAAGQLIRTGHLHQRSAGLVRAGRGPARQDSWPAPPALLVPGWPVQPGPAEHAAPIRRGISGAGLTAGLTVRCGS